MNHVDMLTRAYKVAMRDSKDPRTNNGAVLLTLNGRYFEGANHFPSGVHETPERWVKPLKYQTVAHAETNAIHAAAKAGVSTNRGVLFAPWFACCECAKAIIQAGITIVIGHDAPFHNRPDWQNDLDHADVMLREAGITFFRVVHKFQGISILFDGLTVEP